MKIIVLNNQSLLDIAIQYFGIAEAAFSVADLNDLGLTADLQAGQILDLPDRDFGKQKLADYFAQNKIQPATTVTDEFIDELFEAGIGEMIIENDFIVR